MFVDRGNGFSWLVNKRSGKCIDGGHDWLIQRSCGDVAHHQWQIRQGATINTFAVE